MEMKPLLVEITQNIEMHARFLNSLSYLEYRGFRKIARSQKTEDMDEELLSHAMEEVRHALYFKKLAIKVGGRRFSVYGNNTMLAEDAVKAYFFDLDRGIALLCEGYGVINRKSLYQVVTWLIEERAMRIYDEYEIVLKDSSFNFSLRPVLNDEAKHLADIRSLALSLFQDNKSSVENLFTLEENFFQKTWLAFSSHLKMLPVEGSL